MPEPSSISTSQKVLVVDTEQDFLDWSAKHLDAPSVEILTSTDAESALKIVSEESPDLVIAELHLTPFNGMDLLRRLRQQNPNAMVILNTGFPPTTAVIEAMKIGAYEFLRKEALVYDLRPVVEGALRAYEEMRATNAAEKESAPASQQEIDLLQESMIGKSAAMQDVFKLIGRVSGSDAPVLVTGESGCGKEIVANAIHKYGPRTRNEYVAINCAAIPENLLESELFGHEKGSFTGATTQRIGRFEQCDGGTLFLDEIGDMPISTQSKILRVLQEGEVSRVGGNTNIKTDVRIIAATNKDLELEVEKGTFREDLFYRLNVVRIHIPPLRQRREDVRLLANYFLQRLSTRRGGPRLRFSNDALDILERWDWPGNVRELENTIQRACVLATADILLPKDIPLGSSRGVSDSDRSDRSVKEPRADSSQLYSAPAEAGPPSASNPSISQAIETLIKAAEADEELALLPWMERELTAYAMSKTGNNQVQASKLLGITRATLRKRLERHQFEKEE